ncbi:MAG: hypothetical protein FD180_2950 [Planctomycetota bacterium]|nr:MAG: hypothetical protein FD180_2950 [Planctomycetota bacterium]
MKPFLAIAFAIGASLAFSEEEELNARKDDPWASRKPGTWVKWQWESNGGGEATTGKYTETLDRVEEKQLVFKVLRDDGTETTTDEENREFPEIFKVDWTVVGKETLEVDGKKIECRILLRQHKKSKGQTTSWRGKVNGKEIELKSVAHSEFPDGKVLDDQSRVVKLSEDMKIGDRTVKCMVSESKDTSKEGDEVTKTTRKTWSAEEIPGSVAKSESRTVTGEEETTTAWKVLDFGFPAKD